MFKTHFLKKLINKIYKHYYKLHKTKQISDSTYNNIKEVFRDFQYYYEEYRKETK